MSVTSVERSSAVPDADPASGGHATMRPEKTVTRLTEIPASFFGIVLGLAGLGNAWRAATLAWQLPPAIGETLMAAGRHCVGDPPAALHPEMDVQARGGDSGGAPPCAVLFHRSRRGGHHADRARRTAL